MTKLTLERRSVFGWGRTGAGSANPQNGFVIHFDGSDQGLASKPHAECRKYWKDTRQFHMGSKRGWADIGYSFAVCPHGIAMEGRGLRRQQAAQPGGNSTWYSITTIGGPADEITKKQIEAIGALGAWIAKETGCKVVVSEHRRFIPTSCPGEKAHRLVANGTFLKAIQSAGKVTTPPKPPAAAKPPGYPGYVFSQPPAMKKPGVWTWQDQMRKRGWSIKVDGWYGEESEGVCRRFQKEKRLPVTGNVDKRTWEAAWSAPIT